jgi:hypothetical protein
MYRLIVFSLVLGTSLICISRAAADTVSVAAVADSRVDATQPTSSFPTGDLFSDKEGTPETTATGLQFFYLQFNLPSGLTGQSMPLVNSVNLSLARTGPNLSLTYYIYGVLDGKDTASADTYTWNSGIGYDPTHTLVKFLGADEISYYSDPTKSVFIGSIDTAAPGAGPFDFSSTPQSPTAVAALKNLVMNDTDGRLTFYFGIRQNFGVDPLNTFASRENANFAPPTLTINFVPEPGTALLGSLGLFSVVGFVRRRAG